MEGGDDNDLHTFSYLLCNRRHNLMVMRFKCITPMGAASRPEIEAKAGSIQPLDTARTTCGSAVSTLTD